jgi:transposase-like protein
MSQKQFDQQAKLTIVESAMEMGFKETAEVAGVHWATVYNWKRQLDDLGKEVFLARKSPHPGRGVKSIRGRVGDGPR